ncbi:hypothetical protein [Candidatus Palauibacter sp.]|uniref:hypothetical protein n=1 Tax=Candidatus Palauibacter sp. TaxID=3101350 RepID=UPI003AF2161B
MIEIPKILKDYLTHSVADLSEWVSADTTFHLRGSLQIRVTARDQGGQIVTGAEPVMTFSNGADLVTYRSLDPGRLEPVRLQRESRRGVWSILPGETPAETQFLTVTARLGDVADTIVVILPTTLDLATAPRTRPYGITLDNVGERVSSPLDWFTSRAGAADILYEFLVDEDPTDDGGPPIVDLVQNADGELEITARRLGRRYVTYRARSSAFEQSTGRILTAVDTCYTPERRIYERASTGFRVDLRFAEPDAWSGCAKALLDHAAGFYEAALKANTDPSTFPVIVYEGYEDCPGVACGGPTGRWVDREKGEGFYYSGGALYWRRAGHYAAPFGVVPIQATYDVMLHELGHVFGIGTYWFAGDLRLVNASREAESVVDTHFPGPNAVAAFDKVGGSGYLGGKVPVMNDPAGIGADTHWRRSVCGEIMTYGRCGDRKYVSAITLGALADFGWVVDMSVAEDYAIPPWVLADSISGHDDVVIRVEPPDTR